LLVYAAATFEQSPEIPELLEQLEQLDRPPAPFIELSPAEMHVANIDELLKEPSLEGSTYTRIKASLRRLEREIGGGAAQFIETRQRVSGEYANRARRFGQQGDTATAQAYAEMAVRLDPEFAANVVNESREAGQQSGWQNAEEARQAFTAAMDADKLDEAANILQTLPDELVSAEPYFQSEAPRILSEQYKQKALAAAESGEFNEALDFIDKGLQWSPDDSTLIRWQNRYQRLATPTTSAAVAESSSVGSDVDAAELSESRVEQLLEQLRIWFAEPEEPLSVSEIATRLSELQQTSPDQLLNYQPMLIQELHESIAILSAQDPQAANERADAARELFPGEDFAVE